ncbi:RusA family crossover junction endodeoxyribonuclease [Enterobacter kobei]|nr:RusA family crossover junction endodeoxyribonuclease [Enterobacter kobei]
MMKPAFMESRCLITAHISHSFCRCRRAGARKSERLWTASPTSKKTDLDNLTKSLLDALFEDDSHIWDARTSKVWGETGMIIIEDIGEKNA